jgi:DtxR family Mn-dependent transcriptional regulator
MSAALAAEPLSRSVEDYLKVVLRLTTAGRPASTSEIARELGLSAPSVSAMVKRLAEQELLSHEPYRGVCLTDGGRRFALRVLRRHRIIETYLVASLGYRWDDVHQPAERLEHAVSDDLIERMAAALGNPRFDPHGEPIPATDGTMASVRATPLAGAALGERVQVRRVDTGDPEQLRYLASLGIVLGADVEVLDRQPFDGPVTVRVGNEQRVLSHAMAALLLCLPPDAEEGA